MPESSHTFVERTRPTARADPLVTARDDTTEELSPIQEHPLAGLAGAGAAAPNDGGSSAPPDARHVALLSDPRIAGGAGNQAQRVRLLQRLQRGYGNGHVARVLARVVDPPAAGAASTIQRECAAPPLEKPKLEPAQDPKFQKVQTKVKQVAKEEKSHLPASKKVGEAQAAAEPPANDTASQAAAAQVDKMAEQKPAGFDKAAFIAAVRKAIDAASPKTMDEADNFKSSGKAASVQQEVGGLVGKGKEDSQKAIKDTTEAAPDASAAKPKTVTPMKEEAQGKPPPDVGAAGGLPSPKSPQEVSLAHGPCELKSQMDDAKVTEEQLKKSNEPEFQGALDAKKETEENAKKAPPEFRAEEQKTLDADKAAAAKTAAGALGGMHAVKTGATSKVGADKSATKAKDEAARAAVAKDVEDIYNRAKTDVTKVLTELDPLVDKTFKEGEEAARNDFTSFVKTKTDEFKDKRYSGPDGWVQWGIDKLTSPPPELNQFIDQGRARYLQKMDAVISNVADIIGRELTRAKDRIAQGRKEVKAKVDSLPKDLKQAGQEALGKIEGQFEQLEGEVNDKQEGLVQSLAEKYTSARDALDEQINKMKEENKGLLDKAKDVVSGTIKTILQLKDMLLGVLAKAAGVIDTIIADPIKFLGNLVSAIKQGLNQFIGNIGKHLKAGLLGWLFGELGDAGITMPETLDFKGILSLVLQVLGLTWANLRAQIVKLVGPEIVEAIEKGVAMFQKVSAIVQKVIAEGVGALWEMLVDKLSDLKEQVMGQIQDFLIVKVITAGITWLVSLLNPASAFVKACKMIYDVVMYFVNNGSRIMGLVNAVLDGVGEIANGSLGGAAKLVEDSLAKALPMAISFLASLVGLGGLGEKIKEIITAVRGPINKAIGAVIGPLVKPLKKLWNKGKKWVKGKIEKGKAWVKGKLGIKDDPASQQQRLEKGVRSGKSAIERLGKRRITSGLIDPVLKAIKFRYQLGVLEPIKDNGYWAVHGEIKRMSMRTDQKADDDGGDGKKRGDHVFANGLSQTINDIAAMVKEKLGESHQGKKLGAALAACKTILGNAAYQLTVDKGEKGSDAHSHTFGTHAQAFKLAMSMYITALAERNRPAKDLGAAGVVHAEGYIRTAAAQVNLNIGDFVRAVPDPDAEKLVPERKDEIAQGKAGLKQISEHILEAVKSL